MTDVDPGLLKDSSVQNGKLQYHFQFSPVVCNSLRPHVLVRFSTAPSCTAGSIVLIRSVS